MPHRNFVKQLMILVRVWNTSSGVCLGRIATSVCFRDLPVKSVKFMQKENWEGAVS